MGGASELSGPDLANDGVLFSELREGQALLGQANGESVVLVRRGDHCFAVGASCTHYGGPLAEGIVEGDTIRCPWHHARFDLASGEASGPPALDSIPCWSVERRGERLHVLGKKPKHAGPGGNPVRAATVKHRAIAIVGGGPAGCAAAEMLRREGHEGEIVMFAPERDTPVDRPNLSKDYLAGNAPEEWLRLRSDELLAENAIEVRRTKVSALKGRRLVVDGDELEFDAVLLATGATPIRLDLPGKERAHLLRTLADSRAIVARATKGGRAVVIGSSFIGLEVAASLVARGMEVHVVGREEVPLERVLGRELGTRVHDKHVEKGVRFHLGTSPTAIDERGVVLEKERIDAELVVMGVGVRPDTTLAESAGIAVDRGIVVDSELRTSVPGIWAAGDVARFPYAQTGERVRIEHWVVAEQQGEDAARSIMGKGRPHARIPFFWSAHHELTIGYSGHAESWDRIDVAGDIAKDDCLVAYRRGGKTLAVAGVGRDVGLLEAEAAMERGDEAALAKLVPPR
jgi:NADPH-dependent 2,4-dienoyl-CoA reductase/sulfur reductase-like enzyme